MVQLTRKVQNSFSRLVNRLTILKNKVFQQIDHRPLGSFFGLLGLVLLLIVVGNILRRPPAQKADTTIPPKKVEVYSIGAAPKMDLPVKIEKSGVIKVTASSPGIVSQIHVKEGDAVTKGKQLFWLSNNAQGGTIASVSRQLAQKNFEFVRDNFDAQKEMIEKRREIAQKADSQGDDLREITNDSLDDTRNLISLNDQILTTLDEQLTQLEATNTNGANDAIILQTRQAKSGVMAGLNSLRMGLSQAEYQGDDENAPSQISDLTKDVTLKQLELEEKSLELNRDMAKLNLRIAQISESLMYPASSCNGKIERVYVKPGQAINPGMTLASLICNERSAIAVAAVSSQVANNISLLEPATVEVDGQTMELTVNYISEEPTEGVLNSVIFSLSPELSAKVIDGASFIVRLPVGQAHTTSTVPFVPLDAIYQTDAESYLYVAKQNEDKWFAESRTVTLGGVYGSFVEVKEGLVLEDQVIVNRTVLAGDEVTFTP